MQQKKKQERSVKHRHNIFCKFYCQSRGITTFQRYPWDPWLHPGRCRESRHQDPINHLKFCRAGVSTTLGSTEGVEIASLTRRRKDTGKRSDRFIVSVSFTCARVSLYSSCVTCTGIEQWCKSVIVRRETSLHSDVEQSEDDDTQWEAETENFVLRVSHFIVTLILVCSWLLDLSRSSRCSRTVVFLRLGLLQWLDGLLLVLTRV